QSVAAPVPPAPVSAPPAPPAPAESSTTASGASVATSPSSGTAAAPRPARPVRVPVELRSTPSGARVTLHGRLLGHTPLAGRLPAESTVLLVFEGQGRLSIAERVTARDGLVVTAQLPPVPVPPGLEDLKASPY